MHCLAERAAARAHVQTQHVAVEVAVEQPGEG